MLTPHIYLDVYTYADVPSFQSGEAAPGRLRRPGAASPPWSGGTVCAPGPIYTVINTYLAMYVHVHPTYDKYCMCKCRYPEAGAPAGGPRGPPLPPACPPHPLHTQYTLIYTHISIYMSCNHINLPPSAYPYPISIIIAHCCRYFIDTNM